MFESKLVEGQRVRALVPLIEQDFPKKGQTHTHAVTGDTGIVVHVEPDFLTTVRFDRTGTATCLLDEEVEVIA